MRLTQTVRIAALACVMVFSACASKPPAPVTEEDGDFWSYSRVVDTDVSMITLFDPLDLEHHVVDPPDWFQYDFAFLDDLASGRFLAVLSGANGLHTVRVTNAPLSDQELAVAGPDAELRLRVLNDRLLLAGGDAWPSERQSLQHVLREATQEDWLYIPNGDYKVTVTVLDAASADVHDFVFQLEAIDSIKNVPHAPGIPQLVFGERIAGVAGIDASGAAFNERCAAVPRRAEYAPLQASALPLPGAYGDVNLSRALHTRGLELQTSGHRADVPVVIARNASVGSLGVFISPDRWMRASSDEWGRPIWPARGRVLCAVRIDAIDSGRNGLIATITPQPSAQDRLPHALAGDLVDTFDTWLRVSSDPAFRFKSAHVRRAPDYLSLVFGVMQHLKLPAERIETLLLMSNEARARELIAWMQQRTI